MDICVIGTGYVGLVTGAVFADLGNNVICVDSNAEKIASLEGGIMPIFEPGLEEMVVRNSTDGRLSFTSRPDSAVERSEVIFICVGTPQQSNGEPDVSQVIEAAKAVARNLNSYKVVVNKSTVPVGTGGMVRDIIVSNRMQPIDFDVASNPEFLREGSAIHDTLHPDRIVIGAPNRNVAMKILELYAPLERPMLITDVVSAEIIKYASNAFLATKISFINAIANICEAVGADVQQVVKGMGYDTRIGAAFLNPGLGYGGSCFPKDTVALLRTAERLGYDFQLLRAAIDVNDQQAARFMERLEAALGGLEGRKIGILGLAFKPNTDDIREASSLPIIQRLLTRGSTVRAYDPVAMEKAREIFPEVTYVHSPYEVAEDADAVLLVTEWNEFKLLNLDRLRASMRGDIFFDGRNVYDPSLMVKHGFRYHCVGRPSVSARGGPTGK